MFLSTWRWGAAVGLLVSGFLVLCVTIAIHNDLPEPHTIGLPQFNGRILPLEKIKPGTFTIAEDFEGISQWGQDGILAYQSNRKSVSLRAWRPDQKTAGVFQYAEREFSIPEHWGVVYFVEKVEREGGVLRVYPRTDLGSLLPWYAMAGASLVIGLFLTPVGTLVRKLLDL